MLPVPNTGRISTKAMINANIKAYLTPNIDKPIKDSKKVMLSIIV